MTVRLRGLLAVMEAKTLIQKMRGSLASKKEKGHYCLMKKKTMSKMPMLMKLWPKMRLKIRVSLSMMMKMPEACPAVKAKKKARLVMNRKEMMRKMLLVMKFTA